MRVLVVSAMYPTPENPAFGSFVRTQVQALERAGVDVDVLVLSGANRKLMYPRALLRLREQLREHPVDVVHAHYSYVGLVARSQRQAPVVLTYHGDDILGSVGTDGRTRAWTRGVAAGGRALGEVVDAVVVQTEQMAARFRRKDVHVIPHEVDFEVFHPTPQAEARTTLGLRPDGRYVLFTASPDVPVKNYPLARAAVEHLRAAGDDVELLVVHRETQPRLALYMSAADVLAFPSWQEGSPNTVKQAMACGLPIVATDVGDVRLMISSTEGCHVVGTDRYPFASALRRELELRRRTDGRRAVAHLAPEKVAARLLEVYRQVSGRPGSSSV